MVATQSSIPTRIERLLQILLDTSFHWSDKPCYPLASGALSKFYIDCKMALSYPEFREAAGELILERARETEIDAVGGLALGAYPIAVLVSDAFYRQTGKTIRSFVVRKEPKPHGLKKHIEGDVKSGDRVLIVDDVITTGRSTIDAIVRSQEEGLVVTRAVALIDRQEFDGASNISARGVPFESLITLEDLCDAHVRTHRERREPLE